MSEQFLRTLMRTTDLLVAGVFSPAAVSAIGLSDIYGRLILWVGLGLGDSAIGLSSQDTGRDSTEDRDEVVSQALLLGAATGLPFALFGLVGSYWAIEILGASAGIVGIGGSYLAVIMLSAPAFQVNLIAARSIQGTGDTRTPMYVNILANAINICLTIGLAFGIGPLPQLHVTGIAVATAFSDYAGAVAFLGVLRSSWTDLRLVRPYKLVVTKQLVQVSTPRILSGTTELLVEFPFNAILLLFGVDVNAGYHIGRRLYEQVAAPLSRGYGVGTNILVGQALGEGDHERAFSVGLQSVGLAVVSIGLLGMLLYGAADWLVVLFTRDETTIPHAVAFSQTYALSGVFVGGSIVLTGAFHGGSETRLPFVAKVCGTVVFMLGIAYVFGVQLEYGVIAAHVAIAADFAWRSLFLTIVYLRRTWVERAVALIDERRDYSENVRK